jgi:hypothetical protein
MHWRIVLYCPPQFQRTVTVFPFAQSAKSVEVWTGKYDVNHIGMMIARKNRLTIDMSLEIVLGKMVMTTRTRTNL